MRIYIYIYVVYNRFLEAVSYVYVYVCVCAREKSELGSLSIEILKKISIYSVKIYI